jgi:hypothetical protein
MKKFKKIIALITVAMFLLSFAAPSAFAATQEEAFGRLNALGVAYGDDKGDPMYTKSFTRAEAAAIMVNLLGMKAAIDSAKGATKFKDVPASHWASGVVNLAVGAGVIKGYPDGSYKPDKEVSYAEMSAMLVQVLGYGPKLQGAWPTNVIGKAAQLGLLDGITVTDFNAAAVRSNVFLAADKATTVKPLIEDRLGYVEDTKTLMENKLNVVKKTEAVVTQVPMTSGTKNKVTAGTTFDVIESLDVNPYLGLKVVPWVKDDKVFFLDVKTSASDVIVDTVKAINGVTNDPGATAQTIVAGTIIKANKLDKDYTVATTPAPTIYKNYNLTGATVSVGDEIKLILDANGKVSTVLANSFTRRLVDSVDTTNEKITFKGDGAPGGSEDLKDKVVTVMKGGKVVKLADIKAGNIVDYYKNGTNYYIVVSDATVSGKLTAVAEDGISAANAKKFKVTIDSKEYKLVGAAGSAYYSTDDGKNYTAINNTSDLTSLINQNVTALLNKGGSVAYIKSGGTSATNEFIALVKYTKVVDIGEAKRYIYVVKADGTNTYYEVTKDSKIDGITINETILKTAVAPNAFEVATTSRAKEVMKNEVVKMTLTADGKVDNIKKYAYADILNETYTPNAGGANTAGTFTVTGSGVAIDKNADSININNTGSLAVNADTKIFKVKTNNATPSIDDAEMATWTSVEAIATPGTVSAIAVKDGGVAKVIVIYNDNASLTLASDYKYGVLAEVGNDGKDYLKINEGAATPTKKEGTSALAVETLVRFKVSASDKFTDVTAVTAQATGDATYTAYKVKKIDATNKQLELVLSDANGNEKTGGPTVYRFYDPAKVKVFDISGTNSVVYVSDINTIVNSVVLLYNAYDKDGKDIANGGDATDQTIDFISITKK